jgi:hypothetical protein
MTGDTPAARHLQEVHTAEPRPGEPIEVTFTRLNRS